VVETDKLAGRTALITGGAKRIGAVIAEALADRDVNVVLHCRDSFADAEVLAATLAARGVRTWVVQADLADPKAVDSLLGRVLAEAGPIDILVNSASIFEDSLLRDVGREDIYRNLDVNALAPFVLSRAFAAQGRSGAIVNLLDCMVVDYDEQHVAYHLSKRMLSDLTQMTALEFAPNVRVNAVAPGLILPPAGEGADYLDGLVHTNPLQRHGEAADVVSAALFLLESEFVTGQTIYVDGGRHLKGRVYA
jgi:NAD(P)-dependent dehydrogenase (short-subunit alcohol dehydrogenase family)